MSKSCSAHVHLRPAAQTEETTFTGSCEWIFSQSGGIFRFQYIENDMFLHLEIEYSQF